MIYKETNIKTLRNNDKFSFLKGFSIKSAKIVVYILKHLFYAPTSPTLIHHRLKAICGVDVSYSSVYRIFKKLESKNIIEPYGWGLWQLSPSAVDTVTGLLTCYPPLQNIDTISKCDYVAGRQPHATPSAEPSGSAQNQKNNKKPVSLYLSRSRDLLGVRLDMDYLDGEALEKAKKARMDINYNFIEYLKDCNKKKVVLKLKDGYKGVASPYLILPFETSWNSPKRLNKKAHDFWRKVGYCSEKYDKAIFLTLTTKTTAFKSFKDGLDSLMKSKHKIIDLIKKKCLRNGLTKDKEGNPSFDYIGVVEFGKKNLMQHLHIIIFGTDYLDFADFRKNETSVSEEERYIRTEKSINFIKKKWAEYHGGSTGVYAYGLKKVFSKQYNRDTWLWKNQRHKPKDAGKDAVSYLAKYIIKVQKKIKEINTAIKYNILPKKYNSVYDWAFLSVVPILWASGVRWVFSSRMPLADDSGGGFPSLGIYEVMGVYYEVAIPSFVFDTIQKWHRRGRWNTAVPSSYLPRSDVVGGWYLQ